MQGSRHTPATTAIDDPLRWQPFGDAVAAYATAGREPADIVYIVAPYKGRWIVSLAGENATLHSSFPSEDRAKAATGRYHAWLHSAAQVPCPYPVDR